MPKSDGEKKLAVLISGRGSNLKALLQASQSSSWDGKISVACIVSSKSDAYGLSIARSFAVPYAVFDYSLFPDHLVCESEISNFARQHKVDLVCLAGFMRILSPAFITDWGGMVVNIHPSLLPAFKGLHAQRQALKAGVAFSGCTVHFVNDGVDEGKIIAQGVVPVFSDDTEDVLSARILEVEHLCYPLAIEKMLLGRILTSMPAMNKFMLNIL